MRITITELRDRWRPSRVGLPYRLRAGSWEERREPN